MDGRTKISKENFRLLRTIAKEQHKIKLEIARVNCSIDQLLAIRDELEEQLIPQRELAKRVGLSQRQVNAIIRDRGRRKV